MYIYIYIHTCPSWAHPQAMFDIDYGACKVCFFLFCFNAEIKVRNMFNVEIEVRNISQAPLSFIVLKFKVEITIRNILQNAYTYSYL